jgi:GT2 family glycosyltransferase
VTLDALLRQETETPFEVIVVDNHSLDETKACTLALAGRDRRVRYAFAGTEGIASTRNVGVATARGEILAFTDDDVTPYPSWLAAVVATYRTHEDALCVGGKIVPTLPARTLPAWFDARLLPYLGALDLGDGIVRRQYPGAVWGSNFSVRREALRRVGLFNPGLGYRGNRRMTHEETELVWRIQKAGGAVYYCGRAVVAHRISASRKLTKRFFRRRAYWQGRAWGLLRWDDAAPSWRSLGSRAERVAKTWIKARLSPVRLDKVVAFQEELALWMELGYMHQRWLREQLGPAPGLSEPPAAAGRAPLAPSARAGP